MRTVFYIPKGEKVEDYKDQWFGKTNEVHTGPSENIKNYIEDESVAHFIYIPEFRHIVSPINVSNKEYFQVGYVDDFVDKNNLPQFICEVWTKNLDNPSEEQVKTDTWIMQYDIGAKFFHTDHVKLDIGWYDFVIKSDNEEIDTHEISVYESYDEEE